MALHIDGPVEFECFDTEEEDATFETMTFTVYSEADRIKLESRNCPFDDCEFDSHWKQEDW